MASESEVPQLVRAAGNRAIEQYPAPLDQPDWWAGRRFLSSKPPKIFN